MTSEGRKIDTKTVGKYLEAFSESYIIYQAIRDHYPKIILTMDEEPEEQYEGIRRINGRDWLLGIVD